MRLPRSTPRRSVWWVVGLVILLATGVTQANLADDAKAALERLGRLGDLGAASAAASIREVWQTAETMSKNGEAPLAQARNRAEAALGAAEAQWNASANRVGPAPDFALARQLLQASTTALNAAREARATYATNARVKAATAAADTVSTLRSRADAAADKLRGLVPKPVGTRSETKSSRCRDPISKVEFNCTVPNSPPSDDELRAAINAASAAIGDTGRAAEIAKLRFEELVGPWRTALERAMMAAVTAQAEASKSAHSIALHVIRNTR